MKGFEELRANVGGKLPATCGYNGSEKAVDWRSARDIIGHDVKTARQVGWTAMKHGELLTLAPKHFDVFVTTIGGPTRTGPPPSSPVILMMPPNACIRGS
jgi:hypothetical protein